MGGIALTCNIHWYTEVKYDSEKKQWYCSKCKQYLTEDQIHVQYSD